MPRILEGSVKRLKSGLWAYRLGRDKGSQVGGFATKTEATTALREARARVLAERAGVVPKRRNAITLRELVDEYLTHHNAKANTLRVLADRLRYATDGIVVVDPRTGERKRDPRTREFVRDHGLGDMRVDKIEPRHIGAWRKRLPARSACHITKALRQTLAYAVREGLVARNVAKDVPNPKPPRREIHPFETWADVQAVDAELPPRLRGFAIFGAGTGLRTEELIPLRVRDLDLTAGVVIVRRTFTYGDGAPQDSPTKGKGARRRVPLRSIVLDALRDAGKVGALDEAKRTDPDALLFPDSEGGLLDLQSFRRHWWNPAVENAGIEGPHRTPYALRHTYAAWSLAAGVPLYTLARRMGTSVEMIDETYGHLVADADGFERELLDSFDERIAGTPRGIEIESVIETTPI